MSNGWKHCARCGELIAGDLFYLKGGGWLGQCCVHRTDDGAYVTRDTEDDG